MGAGAAPVVGGGGGTVLDALEPAALGQFFDFFEDQRGLVAPSRVFVAAAHLGEGGVALVRGRVPMEPVPLGAEQLAEGVARREAHADPIGAELLDWRGAEILRLADTHSGGKLTVGVPGSQAEEAQARED